MADKSDAINGVLSTIAQTPGDNPLMTTVEISRAGRGIIAARDIRKGELVGRFSGTIIQGFRNVPFSEQNYVMPLGGGGRWLVPRAPERLVNHSCEPNLIIRDLVDMVATRDIRKGEELGFTYNFVSLEDQLAFASDLSFDEWHSAFCFTCRCGSDNCQGAIIRNLYERIP